MYIIFLPFIFQSLVDGFESFNWTICFHKAHKRALWEGLHAWLQWYNIALTLFPLLAVGVFQGKQTSRQLSRGLGLLWRTCRVASFFKRRDSALDLQTWSGSTYQFSLAWQRQKPYVTALRYPVSQYIIRERCSVGSVRARKNMLFFCFLFFLHALKQEMIDQLLTRLILPRACTQTEPGPRSHLTQLIPLEAACPHC